MAKKRVAQKKSKPVRAWGGFVDGKLDWFYQNGSEDRVLSVCPSRALARRYFADVRRVEVREL